MWTVYTPHAVSDTMSQVLWITQQAIDKTFCIDFHFQGVL